MNGSYPTGPDAIRINIEDDKVIVEAVNKHVPKEMKVMVKPEQAQYRVDWMNGAAHPLNIESQHYTLVMLSTESMDSDTLTRDRIQNDHMTKFNEVEMGFIGSVKRRPEIEWALDNSFDGLYVHRYADPSEFRTMFKFAAYLKGDQATFWKLKYHAAR